MVLLFMFHPMGFQQKEKGSPTIISDNVTTGGHNATIHACEIGKNALIIGFSNLRSTFKNRRF